jgi:hypothetical protein
MAQRNHTYPDSWPYDPEVEGEDVKTYLADAEDLGAKYEQKGFPIQPMAIHMNSAVRSAVQ